ncbi:MAG TPA: flagellar basal-body MS-ring/collar protein FliF [Ramlibacter sp.]|nr:flagellar basal-body MS-ring/collar protein FliF [Ramlibacter sp.]
MKLWWQALQGRARLSLVVGSVLIVLATVAAAWWLLGAERAVLFSELRPEDAAVLAAELDKQKIPYAVADDGATLLVERSQVHSTRLKLMGRDLPLHGGVGFELFNHSDFGMTEFAQKINFQRALQGELTRTILSFPEIRSARVHLALPEQTLFRQAAARPKAAITVQLRPGRALRPEQVQGIQRLVAAAVAGLVAQEVTIVDEHGVALSRPAETEVDASAGSARLDLKRDTENYLSRKAGAVLERAFGPGQALASVDVTLNMEQVRVTTEDVIGAPDARGGAPTGVLVRERESARDSSTPEARGSEARAARGSSMQRDVEYQAGRRVEHVVSQPGSIRRLHVVAVLRPSLDPAQQEQVRQLVAAAVGASFERGDTVMVQSFGVPPPAVTTVVAAPRELPLAAPTALAPPELPPRAWLLLPVFGLAAGLWIWKRRRPRAPGPTPPPPALTESQRRATLQRVQSWLREDERAAPAAAWAGEARRMA